ncbi:MAG: glycoside hydrolase family 130 protein [Vulcanimicrobiaceae bacterium]
MSTIHVERLGTLLGPSPDAREVGGVLNPASARTRAGTLLLYPRDVEHGNISRIGLVRVSSENGSFATERLGYALEPQAPYELREHPGYGCEDPRVTFVPVIDRYVMAYTAFGPAGPRIALALSQDGYRWERLGIVDFSQTSVPAGDDKDAAFFPEPVLSPHGVTSLAFYHRPMLHLSAVDGRAAIPLIQRMPYVDRESICIAYVPLDAVLDDLRALCTPHESVQVLSPDAHWGRLKVGAGTPPVRVREGWLSFFHGVDVLGNNGHVPSLRYSAGAVVHDAREPHRLVFRSMRPVLVPRTDGERSGIVSNVVFPSAIDARADLGHHIYDIFYGMADYAIGAARVRLG